MQIFLHKRIAEEKKKVSLFLFLFFLFRYIHPTPNRYAGESFSIAREKRFLTSIVFICSTGVYKKNQIRVKHKKPSSKSTTGATATTLPR